jgi:low molecular weight phosphotyrosine protein phosphatase
VEQLDIMLETYFFKSFYIQKCADSRTIDICIKNNVAINHSARQLCTKDFTTFDYILCMDESNLENVLAKKPQNCKAKIQLFGDYDAQAHGDKIIKDPYYGGMDGFQKNFQQVSRCSIGLLVHLGLISN